MDGVSQSVEVLDVFSFFWRHRRCESERGLRGILLKDLVFGV
jgi:hypothetical protein